MLCFVHGFDENEQAQHQPSDKTLKYKLLRKTRASLKFLSTSSPAMTAALPPPPSPKIEEVQPPTVSSSSKAREKKFHRHFPSVDQHEKVLNYYSCALIGDILLQGRLYITRNYFAFYSNVFGYVTKLLIPILSVEKITKEKTARIIPNAVGISTCQDKHVFGSLMSRENTYKYMIKIWQLTHDKPEKPLEEIPLVLESEQVVVVELQRPDDVNSSDSSETKDVESEKESSNDNFNARNNESFQRSWKGFSTLRQEFLKGYEAFFNMPTHTLILFAATFLLMLLFLSAVVLIYRINKIQDKYFRILEEQGSDEGIHSQLLRFSMNLHEKSANSVHNFVDSNLQQIVKIREDLEALSSILLPKQGDDSSLNS